MLLTCTASGLLDYDASLRMAGPPQQAPRQSQLAIHNRQRPPQAQETVPSVRVTRATRSRHPTDLTGGCVPECISNPLAKEINDCADARRASKVSVHNDI